MLFLKLFIAALIFIAVILSVLVIAFNVYRSIAKDDGIRPIDYTDFDDPYIYEDEWL